MGAGDVLLPESCVGFGDADELNFRMLREIVEEALDVTVDEADYGYADGWGLGGAQRCDEV